jgi:integrase/recombinase XerD
MKFKIEILTSAEYDAIVATCTRCSSGLRDRALIAVLAGAGLRLGEALALRPLDINLAEGMLTVHQGKGDKRRVCGMTREAQAILEVWICHRRTLGLNGNHPVFCQIKTLGQPMAQANVRQMLRRRAKKAGIEKRVHAHGFRHMFAFRLANEGLPMHQVQQQLGHSNVAVTSRYIAHLNPRDTVQAIRDLEPAS